MIIFMAISYKVMKNKPTIFFRIAGITVDMFDDLLKKFIPLWEKAHEKKPSVGHGGRHYKLPAEDMLLMQLVYYRCYITQEFLGHLFGLDDSRVCRIFKKTTDILSQISDIKSNKEIQKEETESLIIDATEQPTNRPQKNQADYYSGKKKRHTLKTEIRTTLEGKIVAVSKTVPGAQHDFALHQETDQIPQSARVFVDSGYQGMQRIHQATELPYKKQKNGALKEDEKEYNAALSRIRVKIEHIIGDIKTFRMTRDTYRNRTILFHNKVMNILAYLVNVKNGFSTI